MKKLLIGVCVIAFSALFIQAWTVKPIKKRRPANVQKTLNGVEMGTINTPGTALKMIEDFKSDCANDVGYKSVSEWYSKSDLQKMLAILTDANETKKIEDGVRFYFGEESKNGKKIKVKILLVTTKKRDSINETTSTHGDYYDHDANLALQNEVGIPSNVNASTMATQGGIFYRDTVPRVYGNCPSGTKHDIDIPSAYDWIQRRHDDGHDQRAHPRDNSGYNTRSEWFDLSFIQSLFSVIIADTTLDGLRVYLGKGQHKDTVKYPGLRDSFILTPTKALGSNYHEDVFKCLPIVNTINDKLELQKINSDKKIKKQKLNIENLYKNNGKNGNQMLIEKLNFNLDQQPTIFIGKNNALVTFTNYVPAVYDNGELCPNVCD